MPAMTVSDRDIVEALRKLVTDRITPGTFVILEGDPARNYFIQFAIEGDRIFCEAVSNQYLKSLDQLTSEQLRTLENLGWRAPEHEGQNWFRTFRPTRMADYEAIVPLARRAFVEVYGLAPDTPLVLKTSWQGQQIAPITHIEFASEGHRSTYDKIAKYSIQLYGDSVSFDPRKPLVFVQQGSAFTTLCVNPIGIHSSVVEFYCLLVRQPRSGPDLFTWLLRQNYRIRFGALSIDGDGDIVLKHTLVGDTLTADEIRIVLGLLVDLADDLDEKIVEQFGGFTARDWVRR